MSCMGASCAAQAVKDDWYFQMYYDDLPVWGFIGKMEKIIRHGESDLRYFLFTHIEFDIKYNDDKVIEINVSTNPDQAVDISEDKTDVRVTFKYSVRWISVATPWERRLHRYERFPLNPVHLEVGGGGWEGGRRCSHNNRITACCCLPLLTQMPGCCTCCRSTGSPSSTRVSRYCCSRSSWPPS